jgi:hypothetical protein
MLDCLSIDDSQYVDDGRRQLGEPAAGHAHDVTKTVRTVNCAVPDALVIDVVMRDEVVDTGEVTTREARHHRSHDIRRGHAVTHVLMIAAFSRRQKGFMTDP